VVDEIQSDDADKGKRNPESPLGADLPVRGISATVEDEEGDDKDCLIEELAPTLHGESEDDISAAVHSVFDRRLVAVVSFHSAGTGHGILAANAEGIEHQRKRVHDNPTLQ
jgi:hypothetical protein